MSDYHKIYEQVQPVLNQIEDLRITALKKKKKSILIAGIILVIAIIIALIIKIFASIAIAVITLLLLGILPAAGIYKYYPAKDIKIYKSNFKDLVISAIATALEPSSTYSASQGIPSSIFKDTGHYRRGIDRYRSEDCFKASIGSTDVMFSEVHAEYQQKSTDSSGKTTKTWKTIFKGVLFIADFHKNFNTWLIIKPDNESFPVSGWINKKLQKISSSHVRMEDPDFENHFKVNAGDDQQARYLLTPDMQQRLLQLREIYGSKIIISLKDSEICITTPNRSNLYESDIKVSSFNEAQVTRIAKEIEQYFDIVKLLNLNTRIWTKE